MADQREYLRIPNWEQLQARKDKNLRWLKLHANLLRDEEWRSLTQHQKGCLSELWMLAADQGNRIPYDTKWIAGQTGLRTQDVETLLKMGLVERFSSTIKRNAFSDLLPKWSDKSPTESRAEQSRSYKEGETVVTGTEARAGTNGASRPRIDIPNLAPPSSRNGRNCDFNELKRKVRSAWTIETQRDPDSIARNTGFSIKQVHAALKQLRDDGELQ